MSGQAPRLGFTLAEVLITLGIIGVVAAMTMPSLITKYQKQVAVEQYKKIYSTLKNAESRAVLDYGDSAGWDYSDADIFVNTYYIPYLKVINKNFRSQNINYKIKNMKGDDLGTWLYYKNAPSGKNILLADGAIIKYWKNNQFFLFQVDANGAKGPNVFGKDIWDFELYARGPRKLVPNEYIGIKSSNYDTYYNWCKGYTPASGSGCPCSGLLMYNHYKMDENYPW